MTEWTVYLLILASLPPKENVIGVFQLSAHQLLEVISRPGELGRDEAGVGMSSVPQAQHLHLHKLREIIEACFLMYSRTCLQLFYEANFSRII